jgi:nicotinamide-nucleotide amidase
LIKKYNLEEIIHYKVLKTIDLGESNVDDLIGKIMETSKNPTVGVLAHPGQVDVRIAAKAKNKQEATKLISPVKKEIENLLGENIFGEDEDTLEKVVAELLIQNNQTISVFENISSGVISNSIKDFAKNNFNIGLTSGDKNIHKFLKKYDLNIVDKSPEEVCLELAKFIKTLSSSDIGFAYYGITNGDENVQNLGQGESYFAIFDGTSNKTKHVRSAGIGIPDKRRAIMSSLSLIRNFLK